MVQLNSQGEVADFVNESQFEGGETAYACVAFSAALCRYAGKPGNGPIGTGEQVDQLADYYYAKLEGSSASSNTNGMSLQAEYTMLQGLGLKYYPAQPTIAYIKAWLALGYPVLVCGAETGMYDMDLGDKIPYSWQPSGNHCIVASGIASDGNLLVRDTASIGSTGVRPGPRRYDANKMQLVSATAVSMPWLPVLSANYDPLNNPSQQGDLPMLQLTDPMGQFFTQTDASHWHCNPTNVDLIYGHLAFYRQYQGIFGLPRTNEITLAQMPNTAIVVYERAIACYDPSHKFDNPPGSGQVYLMHTDNGGVGQQIIAKPLLAALQAQIDDLNKQIIGLNAEIAGNPSATTVEELQTQVQQLRANIASYQEAVKQVDGIIHPLALV